jgi:leader peptidase (prepilin peptidase)/N-methyltransferase
MPDFVFAEQLPAIVLGLLLGSFLNVCIYRWPNDLSVVTPRSCCPGCERQIAAWDNIPVLSFLLLAGKCRHCRAPISWRYPVVELLTALCFAWFTAVHGLTLVTAANCVFAFLLIGLVFSDLETLLLPDELTLGGAVVGMVFSLVVPVNDSSFLLAANLAGFHPSARWASCGEALFGATAPAGIMWLVGYLFEKIRHKEGLGFGDVKMMVMIGAFLGVLGMLQTLILASMAATVIGLAWLKLSGKDSDTYHPFGAYLGAAALISAITGPNWFWKLMGGV